MTARTVLLTAVGGGGVGEQLLKALRLAGRPYRIVGADAQRTSLGLQEVDVPVILPLAAAPDYTAVVLATCARFGVRAVYPGSEPELVVLARERERLRAAGVVLFANTDAVLATCLDKAATAAFLSSHGFRAPASVLVREEADLDRVPFLPAILKPNAGAGGSANTFVAQTAKELRLLGSYLLGLCPGVLAQEYVGAATGEYTAGVLTDLDGALVHSIAVRRHLLSAFSSRSRVKNRTGDPRFGDQLVVSNGVSQGDIGPFPQVTAVCERLAAALGSRGPLNVQCRLVGDEVVVFEVNPRFSGTASLRALVGFNEPDLLYRRHVEGELLAPRFPYRSGHIARGLREVLVDPALEGATIGAGDFCWRLPPLPFVLRPLETPSNGAGLPDALPFALTVDAGTGLLRQVRDPVVAAALERAYVVGSEIPGLMEGEGLGREYADDFLALLSAAGAAQVGGRSVLEVGCGTGYLLSRLKGLGATVLGVEPGPHGQRGAATHDVPVVQGFFPCAGVEGRFDLVILYLVLEHLDDPSDLLAAVRARLAPGGQVAVVVPDSAPFLAEGDVSLLLHEHYAYFTAATLAATLRAHGADDLRVRSSSFSKLLFGLFSFGSGRPDDVALDRPLVERLELAHRFRTLADRTAGRLVAYFAEARALGETVGVYVPGRLVNYVALAGLDLDGVRFFDDSPRLRGRYYPGLPIPVEGGDDLVRAPTARVLIMSASFGARIERRLAPSLPPGTRITTLDELLRGSR